MLETLFLLLPTFALQDPAPEVPAPVEVPAPDFPEVEEPPADDTPTPEEALEMLAEAFKSREADLIIFAIEDVGQVKDKKVVKAVSSGLKHKEEDVRMATLEALRWNEDPEALKVLLKEKRNKKILDAEITEEAYYLALGQKANKNCLKVLTDNLHTTTRNDKGTQARILALGRIREKDSVEALMGFMTSGGGRRGGGRGGKNMTIVATSLEVLTGENYEGNVTEWIGWWNDNKKKLKISKDEWQPKNKRKATEWKLLWTHPEKRDLLKKALKKGTDAVLNADDDDIERLRKKAEERKKKDPAEDDEF